MRQCTDTGWVPTRAWFRAKFGSLRASGLDANRVLSGLRRWSNHPGESYHRQPLSEMKINMKYSTGAAHGGYNPASISDT